MTNQIILNAMKLTGHKRLENQYKISILKDLEDGGEEEKKECSEINVKIKGTKENLNIFKEEM